MPDGKYTLDPLASTLAGTEKMPIVQSGIDKHATPNLFKTFIVGSLTPTEISYLSGASSNLQAQINAINTILSGLAAFSFKKAVTAATTANITLSGLQTIDGVSLSGGERVLVKNQTTKYDNGIYRCNPGPWTREADFDDNSDLADASAIFVEKGTYNADKLFVCTSDDINIGVTPIDFVEYAHEDYLSKTATYTATPGDMGKTIDCSGTFALNLPSAVGLRGKKLTIKNTGVGTITVTPDGTETIDGAATKTLSVQYEGVVIQSNDVNWIIIGAF